MSPRSTPTVAAGTPGGLCAIDNIESNGTLPPTGTPITGLVVIDATAPRQAAANPAIATKTVQPSASADFTISSTN